jgi:hypothetical protein
VPSKPQDKRRRRKYKLAVSRERLGRVAGIGIWTPDRVQKFVLEIGGRLTRDFKGE